MTNHTNEEVPPKHLLTRFSVGDCEMRPNPKGQWINATSLLRIINWLIDEDSNEVILKKLARLKQDLA